MISIFKRLFKKDAGDSSSSRSGTLTIEYRPDTPSSMIKIVHVDAGMPVYFRGNWYTRDVLESAKVLKRYVDKRSDRASLVEDQFGRLWYTLSYNHIYFFCRMKGTYWAPVQDEEEGDAFYRNLGCRICSEGSYFFTWEDDPGFHLVEYGFTLKDPDNDPQLEVFEDRDELYDDYEYYYTPEDYRHE